MTANVVELRLFLRPEHRVILRGTTALIAGNASFAYDQVMQLRVASSEIFDIALRHAIRGQSPVEDLPITFRFAIGLDQLEIEATYSASPTASADVGEEEMESRALLASLVDEVTYGTSATGEARLRVTKRLSASRVEP